MRARIAGLFGPLMLIACSQTRGGSVADSTAAAVRLDDSIIAFRTEHAAALADTARSTLAVLLKHPESALFDSLIVVQPPKVDGNWPPLVVCGRIGGKPGIGGRSTMTPFAYQNRINVFVLDQSNTTAFGVLRAKGCDNPGARVLLK